MPHTQRFLQHGVIGHSVFHLLLACIPCHIPSAVLPTLGTNSTRELCVFANKWQQKQDQTEFIKVDKHPPAVSLSLCLLAARWRCGCHLFPQRKVSPFLMRTFPFHEFLPWAMDQTVRVTCVSELLHDSSLRFLFVFFSSRQRIVAHYICALEKFPPFSSNTEPKFWFLLIYSRLDFRIQLCGWGCEINSNQMWVLFVQQWVIVLIYQPL